MRLSPSPDLGPWRHLLTMTALVGAAVCGMLAIKNGMNGLGDTDDATRLVIVRDLLAGRGWYDQWIGRFDPPQGVYMHWSRLLDGGIAGFMSLLRLGLPASAAEWWGRYIWPLAWIFPAVAAGLVVARNLGGRSAVLLASLLLLIDLQLYRQFVPGRIDHHNIQIVMVMIALAGATSRGRQTPWAIGAGMAAAMGLAVGLEALPLQALIGASFGLELARDRKAARRAAAYGLSLAMASVAFFLVQTPPWRWSLTFCDALAVNLVVALAVAGFGLALTAWASHRTSPPVRLALLAFVGIAAAGAYLGIAPRCIHGPFADMNPAVLPFWFNRIQEVQPLPRMLDLAREAAIIAIIMMVMGLAAGTYLVARERRAPRTATLLATACVVLASVTAYFTWRMQDYVFWIGLPMVGAALSLIAARRIGDLMLPSVLATILLCPLILGGAAASAISMAQKAGAVPSAHPGLALKKCYAAKAYIDLAALPRGLVLSEQDLGPFILAFTHHSALAAPYHRISRAILETHEVWNASPSQAEALVRRLGITYIVDCPPYPMATVTGGFGARLRAGERPSWLEPRSPYGATLKIFEVESQPHAPA